MHNFRREEIMDDVHAFEDELGDIKIFRPIKAGWRKLMMALEPVSRFHDKYIVYVLNTILVVGTALVVLYVYMNR